MTTKAKPLESLRKSIKIILSEKGWTESELARRSGLNKGSLNQALNKSKDLQLSTLFAIAKGLNVSASQLLQDKSETELNTSLDTLAERLNRLEAATGMKAPKAKAPTTKAADSSSRLESAISKLRGIKDPLELQTILDGIELRLGPLEAQEKLG